MALNHTSSSFKPCLLLILIIGFCSPTNGAQNRRFRRLQLEMRIGNSLPSHHCSRLPQGLQMKKKISLVMTHKYGPCSPFGGNSNGAAIAAPSLGDILAQDEARSAYFRRRILKNQTLNSTSQVTHTTIPGKSGEAFGLIGFVATLGIGFPAVQQTVQIDTGSDLCWLHCTPCSGTCHLQREQLFNPLSSASYRNVSCKTTYCREIQTNGCDMFTDACLYSQRYADAATTVGKLSQDTLTLSPTSVFTKFIFGCDTGDGTGFSETTAGVFGFGRGILSIVSQLSATHGNTFSYCIPRSPSTTGYITFGSTGSSSANPYTPMLTDTANPSFYMVEVLGVRVSGKQLNVQPTSLSSYDTIVDSGTSFTHMPAATYDALRSAFAAAMAAYRPTVVNGWENCYDFTGLVTVYVPSVELLLRGVTLDLSAENVLYMVGQTKGCLAFRPSLGGVPNIIGNVQLKSYEVVHNLDKKIISFVQGAC